MYVFVPIRTEETYYAGEPGGRQHPITARLRASSTGGKWAFDLVLYIPEGNGWEASGGFTGTATAEPWFGGRNRMAHFYDGRLLANGHGPHGRITKLMGTTCYTTTVSAYVNGMLNTTYTSTTCIGSGGPGPDDGWGPLPEPDPRIGNEDDGSGDMNYRTAEIHNDLTNPCLKDLLNEILDKQFINRIGAILEEFDISEIVSLDFTDTNPLPSDRMGQYNDLASTDGRFQIDLNKNQLPNSSKEYATVVVFHETIHAYLAKNNIDINFQHQEMFLKYRTTISDALVQMYGTNQQLADDLAFAGLTVRHENYDWWDWYMTTIPQNKKNRIMNTINDHQNGTQGTALCNP
ncbi:hypothetical protein [Parapedobacter sp. 10938]|uniref:hypothetical protein n=1 Tax=Parapedobacter flavus TaxID=3110225 RepID=UPI002DB9C8E1|nr:hypothetical protein [Parapedobacter sp. 10938]MEC3878767.1 hypothetical protein [Parapedobacter sp. 10938]